ncbi:MAG TPA: archaemetzincin [Anaeromyxobacteraceae bacterium]|nr:archaemetzincin [Anaeromyxobacteraceae bacterium]
MNQRAELRPLAMPARVTVLAVGTVQRPMLAEVGAALTHTFGPASHLGPAQTAPVYAFNKDRQQYHSTAVLRRLAQLKEAALGPVLAVTDVDLFVPDAPFVFGEADRDARTAIVSLCRLGHGPDGRPAEPERLRRRLQAESIHELGHLLGLSHCQDARCAMFLSHKPSDSDRKGAGLCVACRTALGTA